MRKKDETGGLAASKDESVVPASSSTLSWLQLLTGQPGQVVIESGGRAFRVELDEARNARVLADPSE